MTSYADPKCYAHFFDTLLNLPSPTILPEVLLQQGITNLSTLLLVDPKSFDEITYQAEDPTDADVKPVFLTLDEKLRLQQGIASSECPFI